MLDYLFPRKRRWKERNEIMTRKYIIKNNKKKNLSITHKIIISIFVKSNFESLECF